LHILVTGLLPYDSGKTTIAMGVSRELRNRGFKVFYFKPIAGHSVWYQPETIKYSLETGMLVGHDAYVVSRELGLLDMLRLVNPVDFLTMPPDPLGYVKTIRFYINAISDVLHQIVLMRISLPGSMDEYMLVRENASRLNNTMSTILESLIKRFSTSSDASIHEVSREYIDGILYGEELYNNLDSIYGLIKGYDVVVTESYSNSAAPIRSALNADVVLIAAPSKLLVYGGERYRLALHMLASQKPPWYVEAGSVVEIISNPVHAIDVPYVDSREFGEAMSKLVEFIILKYSK